MNAPAEALCEKNVLHNYVISRELPDATIEVCLYCSQKAVYIKKGGRIDNLKQLRAHFRDTLQPFGRTGQWFKRIYGEKDLRKALKNAPKPKLTKEQQDIMWEETQREAVRDLRGRDDYGKKMIFT